MMLKVTPNNLSCYLTPIRCIYLLPHLVYLTRLLFQNLFHLYQLKSQHILLLFHILLDKFLTFHERLLNNLINLIFHVSELNIQNARHPVIEGVYLGSESG